MDELLIRSRMNLPVTTGIPAAGQHPGQTGRDKSQPQVSFQQLLERTAEKQELAFSKHAAERVVAREIALSEADLARLDEGLRIARDKGLEDALLLMNGSAFIVSAKNGRVITALSGSEAAGKVITNISGAVIL